MIDRFFEIEPYALRKEEKEKLLSEEIRELTEYHYSHCHYYRRMMDAIGFQVGAKTNYEEIPFLPVSLFKRMELKSIPQEDIFKVMTSSGTTGQAVSKIYLDRETSSLQQKTLARIVTAFTGNKRLPMIIIDCPSVVKNRAMFSARGAGILGFSMFGTKRIYALDDDMKLDLKGISDFLESHKGERILLFGFTFMIWQHFYKELLKLPPMTLDLSSGILIHGGGWKKLISEQVSEEDFHSSLEKLCGLHDIHDYYGMVEQTGCVYMECECGHLHASIFSDVLIRNPQTLELNGIGERGIIQVVSALPKSYPGHSLLTEDEGSIEGIDDCPCGRKGKYFRVNGRLRNAEIRGCSDTYASKL